jgi:hypothetical protein
LLPLLLPALKQIFSKDYGIMEEQQIRRANIAKANVKNNAQKKPVLRNPEQQISNNQKQSFGKS